MEIPVEKVVQIIFEFQVYTTRELNPGEQRRGKPVRSVAEPFTVFRFPAVDELFLFIMEEKFVRTSAIDEEMIGERADLQGQGNTEGVSPAFGFDAVKIGDDPDVSQPITASTCRYCR